MALVFVCACGGTTQVDDSGADAGDSPDAAVADAGLTSDAGNTSDSGTDAGAVDAGETDAGLPPWTIAPGCQATLEDVLTATSQLAPPGTVLACLDGGVLDLATTQDTLNDEGAEGVTARTGVALIKFAYRTTKSDGTPAVSPATVYVPLEPRAVPAPVVLIGRSTSGLADTCAPVRDALPVGNVALPFAASGFVTVLPDFSGLGNAGTHAYLDNHEAATQLFDAATAVRALLPGLIGENVAAVGYSQGGGVVLSAQALEFTLTGERHLRAVAAIAPEWPLSTRSFGYEGVLRNPNGLTVLAGLSAPTVTVLRHYGFMSNRTQSPLASFPAAKAAALVQQIESLCTIALGGALNGAQPYLRDLVDETFRLQVLACIDSESGCEGHGAAFHAWLLSDIVTADPLGARVLLTQGLADAIMPAAKEAACCAAHLRDAGVEPDLCIDATATHDTVLEKRIEDVVAWVEAVVSGAPVPSCGSTALPACSQ